ncbi:MAG: hypothetical protein ACREJ9_12590 [Candidatus Rokuibacteriota bacterium]
MAKAKGDLPGIVSVLPSQPRVGDRYDDEEGEWEVVGHPFTTGEVKVVHARVQRHSNPTTVRQGTWPAHQRIKVRRDG